MQKLGPDELWTLGALAEKRHYGYSSLIVKEGKQPEGMFIILKGECQVFFTKSVMLNLGLY